MQRHKQNTKKRKRDYFSLKIDPISRDEKRKKKNYPKFIYERNFGPRLKGTTCA